MPQRSSKMNDEFSANLFQAQKMNTKNMKKKWIYNQLKNKAVMI